MAMPSTAPDTLSLEYQDLTDLRPLMPKLAAMPRLAALNLNGNRLSSLPSDMSSLRKLKTLDLAQNMFTSINAILPALKTLPVLTGASHFTEVAARFCVGNQSPPSALMRNRRPGGKATPPSDRCHGYGHPLRRTSHHCYRRRRGDSAPRTAEPRLAEWRRSWGLGAFGPATTG